MDHWHSCPECERRWPCDDRRHHVSWSRGLDVERLCPRHARLEWVRFCDVIAACVIAACVEDYAEARAWDAGTGVPFGDGDANVRAARDALCGRERT